MIFELLEYPPEVRIKFLDIMNFIKYFNEKRLKLSVNQFFDNFNVIFWVNTLPRIGRHVTDIMTHF